jgi:hypothetical protein
LFEAMMNLNGDGPLGAKTSDITIEAWKIDPMRFGLEGYERTYPDYNRVLVELIKRKDMFIKVGEKRYTLNPEYVKTFRLNGNLTGTQIFKIKKRIEDERSKEQLRIAAAKAIEAQFPSHV